MKSQCSCPLQTAALQQEIDTLTGANEVTVDMTSGTPAEIPAATVPVEQSVVDLRTSTITHAVIQEHRFTQRPDTPLNEIVAEVENIDSANELYLTLNSPAPFDNEPSRSEVADKEIQALFDKHRIEQQGDTQGDSDTDPNSYNHSTEVVEMTQDPNSIDAARNELESCYQLMRSVTSNPAVLESLERAREEACQL